MNTPFGNGLTLPSKILSVAPPPLIKTEPSTLVPAVQSIQPLPVNVQLNLNFTKASTIPPTSSENQEIQGWQARDDMSCSSEDDEEDEW